MQIVSNLTIPQLRQIENFEFCFFSSCRAPPAACSWGNAFHNQGVNPHTLNGALIAGPARDGSFTDDRSDYISNEVATDYNAGFQGAVAGMSATG